MIFEQRIFIKAHPESIFSVYANVGNWSQWDKEIKYANLKGQFKVGTEGVLKPKSGPKSKITIADIVQNKSFTVTSKLPLCRLSFEHELHQKKGGTEVIHRVVFSGATKFIFGMLVGSQINKGLPSTLRGLKKKIESGV